MRKILTLVVAVLLLSLFNVHAQTTGEPQKSENTKVEANENQQKDMVGCHGGMMKPGCCASKEAASAKKSGKKSKGKDTCCLSAGENCCTQAKNVDHSEKPCHPGCTMPCCTKKE